MSIRRPTIGTSPEVERRLLGLSGRSARLRRLGRASSVLALCLTALLILTWLGPQLGARMSSPIAAKLGDAERVVYYVVEDDRGPVFRIGAGDHSLKLITHLLLPAATRYDPEQDYAYGMELILRELDGREVARQRLDIRTRQSKSGAEGYGWRQENAFMLGDPRELTDDRLTRVRLPEADHDRLLELRLIPRFPSVEVSALARIYVRRSRPVDERMLQGLALAPRVGRSFVGRLTYRDWEQLSKDEREVKLSSVWERLAAVGSPGRDYQALSVYETGFRLARGARADERRLELDRWRSLAVNLLGPAELELRMFGDPSVASGVEVSVLGLDGELTTFPRDAALTRSLTIPPGVHTLFIESERALELELEVSDVIHDGAERVWWSEADRPTRRNAGGNEVLEPDQRRIEVVQLGSRWRERPRWKVPGPEHAFGRFLRFDVRVVAHVADSWWPKRGPAPSLDVCFLDREGVELRCDPWTGRASIGSRFEGLREDQVEGWYVASEPQTLRVIAPIEAASVELRDRAADQRLLIRAYGYWPEVTTTLAEPFASHDAEPTLWRYPPFDLRAWFPLRPSNYDQLHDDRAIARLYAQVRLERRGLGRSRWDDDLELGDDGWDPGPWITLEPRGVHRRRSILERLDDDAARRLLERWDASLLTKLVGDRPLIVDFGAGGPGPAELHWHVDPRTLGRSMSVRVDDTTYTRTLTATRGRWRLPIVDGRRRLTVDLEDDLDADLWLDRPILVASPPVSRRRSIHELTTRLRFPLIKPGVEALTVNLVIYLPRQRERAELVVAVDGGTPERAAGIVGERVSVASRGFAIDTGSARDEQRRLVDVREPIRYVELDARRGLPLDAVTVQLTLGEDVVPGRHEISVELLDGGRVWVRAFHRGVADRTSPALSWTELAEEQRE